MNKTKKTGPEYLMELVKQGMEELDRKNQQKRADREKSQHTDELGEDVRVNISKNPIQY